MEKLREIIDFIDQSILSMLAARNQVVAKIAKEKSQNHHPIRDLQREEEIIENVRVRAAELGLNVDAAVRIFRLIIDDSAQRQSDLISNHIQG